MRSPAIAMTLTGQKPGRNAPCPCGSGKRYKHCCGVERTDGPGRAPVSRNAAVASPRLEGLVTLIDEGRLRDAEEGALRLLNEHPGTGMVWKVLSVALVRQGKNALPALRKTAELMPQDAEAHANLGSALLAVGEWAQALAALQRALELRPNDSESLIEAADAAQALGRAEEALGLYRRAVAVDPHSLRAHNNLGNTLIALGRCEDAVKCYRLALEVKPQDAVVLSNLADALRQLGQLEEAVRYGERAVALDPALARAHNVLGLCLGGLGHRARAVAGLRQALALDPGSVETLTNLANVLREVGERRESLALYRRALELDPRRAESHCGLANLLFELRRLDEAAESHRRALALRPGYILAHVGLAAVLRVQGRGAEAEASCQAALTAAPGDVEALVLLAELRGDHGRFAEAQELLEQAIRLDPQCVSAYCSIAAHRKMGSEDSAWLAAVEALIEQPLPLAKSIALRYALGKYCDDVGQYESAFRHYREANELTRRYGSRYDGNKLAMRIGRLVERFDAAFIGELRSGSRGQPRSGTERQDEASLSDRPVFIIGMPRSGTSLAEQILASHPQVFGAGEVRFWDRAFASLEETRFEARSAAGLVPRLAREYLARLAAAPASAARVVDKMPANFLYAGLIHAAFPRARLIHMQRDPTDTCLSIYFQNFFNMSPYGHDLEHLAHYYAEYLRIMAHWRAVLPSTALLEVPYEALVADPERWTRRMLAFIGMPWDPRCLDFHRTERSVITASRWQVRQRIHASSVGRWRNYEKHLGPLRHLRSLVPSMDTAGAAQAASAAGADGE